MLQDISESLNISAMDLKLYRSTLLYPGLLSTMPPEFWESLDINTTDLKVYRSTLAVMVNSQTQSQVSTYTVIKFIIIYYSTKIYDI